MTFNPNESQPVTIPIKDKTMIVTARDLRRLGACADQRKLFKKIEITGLSRVCSLPSHITISHTSILTKYRAFSEGYFSRF